ncbi:MAG: BlaI/MecI/CopY family transcriptional regulator [Pirellulales bacterium]|nr:BlaI/MecI/CopY family transcriptional regulator [Pirellulales bacterium]
MAKSSPDLPPLSQAQREIMEVIWDHGELSARRVREILAERDRDVARNTVRTLLERMEEKGWLTHREQGRTYLYCAAYPREATAGSRVLEVLDQICGGSPEALMTALIDYRGLTQAELDRIRNMLDAAKPKTSSKQRRGK